MSTHIITRHPGAVEWLRRSHPELGKAQVIAHASEDFFAGLKNGDTVVGVLPLPLAARVCAAGARFFALSMHVPPEMRGKELSADDMERLGASIEEAVVIMGDSLKKARGQWYDVLLDTGANAADLHPGLFPEPAMWLYIGQCPACGGVDSAEHRDGAPKERPGQCPICGLGITLVREGG